MIPCRHKNRIIFSPNGVDFEWCPDCGAIKRTWHFPDGKAKWEIPFLEKCNREAKNILRNRRKHS